MTAGQIPSNFQFNFNERAHREGADRIWQRGNNAGQGFPVGPEGGPRSVINELAHELGCVIHEATFRGDDDKAIYGHHGSDKITVVAWAEGPWAVACTAQELYDAI